MNVVNPVERVIAQPQIVLSTQPYGSVSPPDRVRQDRPSHWSGKAVAGARSIAVNIRMKYLLVKDARREHRLRLRLCSRSQTFLLGEIHLGRKGIDRDRGRF